MNNENLHILGDLEIDNTGKKLNELGSGGIESSGDNYIKFTDGTMICMGSAEGTATTQDYWTICNRTTDVFIDYPQTFKNTPYTFAISTETRTISVYISTNSTTQFSFIALKPTTAGNSYKINYFAIGKWK